MSWLFRDRRGAGRALGECVAAWWRDRHGVLPGEDEAQAVVLALGAGGLLVGEEVAAALDAPLDLLQLGDRRPPSLAGRSVVLVGDGLATAGSMRAAAAAARRRDAAQVVVAVPVASRLAVDALLREVDDVVSLATPEPFLGVGRWYLDFTRATDDEVTDALARARRRWPARGLADLPLNPWR